MSDETKNTANATANEPAKIEFTPEQQAKVNELINQAVGRATASVRREAETSVETLRSELTAAQEALRTAKTPEAKANAKDDILALQSQIEEAKNVNKTIQTELERYKQEAQAKAREVEAAKSEALNVRKEVAITAAASKAADFYNLDVVKALTKDTIVYDAERGTFVVHNEQGQVRLDATLERPLSLEAYFTEFAAKNKYLVRGDVKPGTGSHEASRTNLDKSGKFEVTDIFGPKSNARLANELAKSNPQEYQRMKALARQAGIIA